MISLNETNKNRVEKSDELISLSSFETAETTNLPNSSFSKNITNESPLTFTNTLLSHTSTQIDFELPTHQERFYENLVDFGKLVTEFVTTCYERGADVIHPLMLEMGISFVAGFDKTKLIENFIENSKSAWDKIIGREVSFFLDKENGKVLFANIPGGTKVVDNIYLLLTGNYTNGTPLLDESDKDCLWNYADSWIKICIKYIHDKRKPTLLPLGDNKYEAKYTVKYQTDIKLIKYLKHYDIELDWQINLP